MGMPQGKKKGLSTKKFDRCVTKVKRKGGAKNPLRDVQCEYRW